MQNSIELLDISLLENQKILDEIDHWLAIFNWPNGWHYDLDLIWILTHLEKLKVPPGATILDAGGGLGMMQFILASRGYNVISLDFAKRQIPEHARGIFNIETPEQSSEQYHQYQEFMTYGQGDNKESLQLLPKLKKVLLSPTSLLRSIKYRFGRYTDKQRSLRTYKEELKKDHQHFGKITFLPGTFNKIPLADNHVDALVSVSAFEHNTYADMPSSVQEFNRILKQGAFQIVTTSATDQQKDWYHEPTLGWCFTEETLSKWFAIRQISFDYETKRQKICQSEKLANRIADYYKYSESGALPYGDLNNATYFPVGLIRKRT